jgi:hypothetical protein
VSLDPLREISACAVLRLAGAVERRPGRWAPCPSCGADDARGAVLAAEGYDVWRCLRCGTRADAIGTAALLATGRRDAGGDWQAVACWAADQGWVSADGAAAPPPPPLRSVTWRGALRVLPVPPVDLGPDDGDRWTAAVLAVEVAEAERAAWRWLDEQIGEGARCTVARPSDDDYDAALSRLAERRHNVSEAAAHAEALVRESVQVERDHRGPVSAVWARLLRSQAYRARWRTLTTDEQIEVPAGLAGRTNTRPRPAGQIGAKGGRRQP